MAAVVGRVPSPGARDEISVLILSILSLTLNFLNVSAQVAGFGPPISVSHDLSEARPGSLQARNRIDQTPEDAMRNSRGCLECNKGIDTLSMHASTNVVLGCTDCHGGSATPGLTQRK